MPIITAAAKLRQVLQDPNRFVSAPGVYDGVSARIALNVGFDALYMVSEICTQHPEKRGEKTKPTNR